MPISIIGKKTKVETNNSHSLEYQITYIGHDIDNEQIRTNGIPIIIPKIISAWGNKSYFWLVIIPQNLLCNETTHAQ